MGVLEVNPKAKSEEMEREKLGISHIEAQMHRSSGEKP